MNNYENNYLSYENLGCGENSAILGEVYNLLNFQNLPEHKFLNFVKFKIIQQIPFYITYKRDFPDSWETVLLDKNLIKFFQKYQAAPDTRNYKNAVKKFLASPEHTALVEFRTSYEAYIAHITKQINNE